MYLIAEIGTNHNGNEKTAFKLVNAAAKSGAHAVKMNHWKADLLVSKNSDWYDRCKSLELSIDCLKLCADICHEEGIDFIVAPWSSELVEEAAEIADKLKIASGELTNNGLLQTCNFTGMSTILSTGMATDKEIDYAVDLLQPDAIMHCVSLYPTPIECVNLHRIEILKKAYDNWCRIGYSSHTHGVTDIFVAYAFGTKIIEKHFNVEGNNCVDDNISIQPMQVPKIISTLHIIDQMKVNTFGEDRINIKNLRRNSKTGLRE